MLVKKTNTIIGFIFLIALLICVDVFAQRVAFSPDGQRVAVPSGRNDVSLVDVDTQEIVKVLVGHKNGVKTVAFSPDGNILATGANIETGGLLFGATAEIKLWNLNTFELIRTLAAPDNKSVNSLAFHPDGKLLASAGNDVGRGSVRIWDVDSGEVVWFVPPHNDSARSVVFTPDGKYFISSGWHGEIYMWDIKKTDEYQHVFEKYHRNPVNAMAFSPDGKKFVSAGKRIVIWDTETWTFERELRDSVSTRNISSMVFTPDGNTLALGQSTGDTILMDTEHYEVTEILERDPGVYLYNYIDINAAGTLLVSHGWKVPFKFWQLKTQAQVIPESEIELVEMVEAYLIAHWNFDEGEGDVVQDVSGHGHNGYIRGNPEWVDGKYGKALEFDGNRDYVVVSDHSDLDLTVDFTIMGWFSPGDFCCGS